MKLVFCQIGTTSPLGAQSTHMYVRGYVERSTLVFTGRLLFRGCGSRVGSGRSHYLATDSSTIVNRHESIVFIASMYTQPKS